MKTLTKVAAILLTQLTLSLSVFGQMPPGGGGGSTNEPSNWTPPPYVPGLKMNISPPDSTNFHFSLLEADSAGKYAIYFATNFISATWNGVLQGTNGQTNFTLPIPASQSGFFRVARADQAIADASGISFYFLSGFVNTNITLVAVAGGPAVATAILVDSTNFAGATWIPFSSTQLVDIGTNEGTHEIWFGFRGTNGVVYWTSDTVTLDKTPPAIVITNPVSSTTSRPVIQVQGYSTEPLSGIYFDVTNTAGNFTNQQGFVTAQNFDTNTFSSTTNWFQCFDVELTNGVNVITVRAADLAGNVTTTNVIISLDFSGDTNPPVITVTWPQDGAQISGTNFTLRGVLDDETAQITALTVDTNGVTNIVSGVVERNGTFWLEDLPLNPGMNIVTVTATDAAGNPSMTNLTLFQSDVTLTINTVSDSQLNESVTTVSGTVSDPSYSVWVNGVPTTVDGSGNWATNNVPVYGNGTVCFDAIAYPPGQSPNLFMKMNANTGQLPVQTSLASEQPPKIFISQYSDQWLDDQGYGTGYGSSKNYTATLDNSGYYSYQGNGTCFVHIGGGCEWWDTTYDWSDTSSHYSSIGYEWYYGKDDPNNAFPIDESGPGLGQWAFVGACDIPSSTPGCGQHFYANIGYGPGDLEYFDENYTRSSKTYLKLRTGGKAGVFRNNLFGISAAGTEYGRPWTIVWYSDGDDEWIRTPETTIPPNQIRVLGKNVGNDGNLFIVLPDNVTLDLGATAPGKHYNLSVSPTKYKLFVQANGHILRPDRVVPLANFCVGQQIGFAPVWSPGTPPYVQGNSYFHWNLPGNYFNAETNLCPTCSTDPFVNPNLLACNTTTAWWVSGGTPAEYVSSIGMNLQFPNGQNASIAALGKFNMFRPQAKISPATTSVNVLDGNNLVFSSPTYDDGITFFHTINIPARFSGSIIWVQVASSLVYNLQDTNSIWHVFTPNGASPYGDYPIPYEAFDDTGTNAVDSPGLLLLPHYIRGVASGNFEMWMMFLPAGGHQVPLRAVNWSWSGSATNGPSGWGLQSGNNSPNPSDFETEDYPLWNSSAKDAQFIPSL
jgi:hypothetical protein